MHTKELHGNEQGKLTSKLTLEEFKSGDSEAIGRVYPHLVEFARGFMRGKDGAEDLVQTVFAQAIKPLSLSSSEDFARFGGNVLPYIHRAIVNTRINQVRKAERRVSETQGVSVEELPDRFLKDQKPSIDETVVVSMGEGGALQVLGEGLNRDYLEALYLREVVGLSYQETADALDIPLGTAQSRIHRAKSEAKKKYVVDEDGVLRRKPQQERHDSSDSETVLFSSK